MSSGEKLWNAECDMEEYLHGISSRKLTTYQELSDRLKQQYEQIALKYFNQSSNNEQGK